MNLYDFIYSLFVHISFMSFLYLIVFLCIAYFLYRSIIDTWFVKDGVINYDIFLKQFIQAVSKDNYFMNYGYWKNASNLIQANKALVEFILEKSQLKEKKNQNILDVGCGYGEQDFDWISSLDPTNTITAIDISESQIALAKEKCKRSALESRLSFEVCDAMLLNKKFAKGEFDTVVSVESAFHYSNRPLFFTSVYDVLKPEGKFVICDIVLNEHYTPGILTSSFLYIFSDFLNIPYKNLIVSSEWEKTIAESGLTIVESLDITDKTFKPYYEHFFNEYAKAKNLPLTVGSGLNAFFAYVQPFTYKVAVCKKATSDLV
jgi:SAM-dependent methyltransferase